MGAIARTFGLLLPALLFTQAAAQIQFTNSHYDGIVEGQPFNLTFAGDGSAVTILLKQGPATNLVTISTIASGITTSPYTWTPATTLVPGLYALQIDQSGVTNYSPMITISGANAAPDSNSTSTSDDSANNFPSSTSTVPTSTVPTSSVPTSSVPTSSVPTSTDPTSTIPTSSVPTTTYAMGPIVPTGYNATGGSATGAMMSSGYNMTSGMATGGMSMGLASSTGLMAMPSDMTSFEGAGSKVRVAQWVVCLTGAAVVVVW